MILITGRQLEHWHTGAMTRRATVLDAIEPEPVASMNSADLLAVERSRERHHGDLTAGQHIAVRACRRRTPKGSLFIPFCFYEAAANMLTNPALDPVGKIRSSSSVRSRSPRRSNRRPWRDREPGALSEHIA